MQTDSPPRAADPGVTDGAVLRVEGLTVAAGDVQLLTELDLSVSRGELVGLLGPSGCGKTTLLRCIAGLVDPSVGRVLLDGQTGDRLGWPAFRRGMVLLDQRPVLLDATVGENLRRPFAYRIAGEAFPRQIAEELLETSGVGADRMNQDALSLSVGQQQRVCLIRALLVRPIMLLLDEPTSALDEQAALSIEQVVREQARQRGLASLIVTHDRRQIERWCDRWIDLAPHLVANPSPAGDHVGGTP